MNWFDILCWTVFVLDILGLGVIAYVLVKPINNALDGLEDVNRRRAEWMGH